MAGRRPKKKERVELFLEAPLCAWYSAWCLTCMSHVIFITILFRDTETEAQEEVGYKSKCVYDSKMSFHSATLATRL